MINKNQIETINNKNLYLINDNSDVKNTPSNTSDIQNNISKTKVEKTNSTPKYELKPRIDVTLNTYASGYYKILNEAIKLLNEISKNQREPIRKALIEINKQVKYAEAQIIFKKQDGLYGYQFKDGRLYDKTYKDEDTIRTSKIYNS